MSAARAGSRAPGFDPTCAVLADLDGTLVDTVPDIAACLARVFGELGLPPCPPARVRDWVGDGAEMLVRRALAAAAGDRATEALIGRALDRWLTLYERNVCELSRVYPGVREGLEWMRAAGMTLACVTNKPERHSERLLDELGLRRYFSLVLGGDSLPRRKPDPLPLVHAAEHFGVDRAHALLVGDSANDVRAARAAGMRVICVSYGYNHGADIREAGADAVIDSFTELPALLANGEVARAPRPGRGG
ncbi:MAG: phosphoglycolate phosphatase [Gammaproteobacteria bacterium]|nr:phosphoglycolate phosphatase [Gammaproteobacteria bacterium]